MIDSVQPNGQMNIKIIDFGTALFAPHSTKLKETLGTPYYIAPEVLMGSYTEKCDVWSTGVIIYIMLCGMAPFNGETDEDIMAAVRKGEFSFDSINHQN